MKGKLSLLLVAGCLFAILMSGAGYAQTDPEGRQIDGSLEGQGWKIGSP